MQGQENGRSTHCQSRNCSTKITDVNYFKCPKCKMDLCLKHRFEDEHNCKPITETEQYQKLKKTAFSFNWAAKGKSIRKEPKPAKKEEEELSFGGKLLRFFACCGCEPKDKTGKEPAKGRQPPTRASAKDGKKAVSLQGFNDAPERLKCPLCSEMFEDTNMLLYHTNEFHKEKAAASTSINKS